MLSTEPFTNLSPIECLAIAITISCANEDEYFQYMKEHPKETAEMIMAVAEGSE